MSWLESNLILNLMKRVAFYLHTNMPGKRRVLIYEGLIIGNFPLAMGVDTFHEVVTQNKVR